MHLAGVGDYSVAEVAALPDPCPLPSQLKKRSLNERERLLYAPMSGESSLRACLPVSCRPAGLLGGLEWAAALSFACCAFPPLATHVAVVMMPCRRGRAAV